MTNTSSPTPGLFKPQDLFGLIGAAGELFGALAKFSGKYIVPIFLISSIFIVLWGFIVRKDNQYPFKKALAWLGIIVGAGMLIFFAVIGLVLASLWGDVPSSQGIVSLEKVKDFKLSSIQPTNQLAGQYTLDFAQNANLAEVTIMPNPEDTELVKELYITTKGPPEYTNKMALVINKTTDIQTHYKVSNPSEDFNVTLNSVVQLKQVSSSPSITVRVYYKYFTQNWIWRLQKWVYEKYSGS